MADIDILLKQMGEVAERVQEMIAPKKGMQELAVQLASIHQPRLAE